MRARVHSKPKVSDPPITCSLDLVCLAVEGRDIVVLLQRGSGSWRLPSATWRGRPNLDDAAVALIRGALRGVATWHEQVGAFDASPRHGRSGLSVVFAVLSARGMEVPAGSEWCDVAKLPRGLAQGQQQAVRAAVAHARNRMDQVPIAFRFLAPVFTLSELQGVYEVLLGHRLHKASFRRALQAATLVEATDQWRRDGRGRPAQLFRYAPARRRSQTRALRFEMPGA